MPPNGYKKTVGLVNLTPISGKKEKEKKIQEPIRRTPIATRGKRTKERILQNGTETELFRKIWDERPHVCEQCGDPIRQVFLGKSLIKPQCFAHKLSKGRYPEHRYNPKNIGLVCSIECHHEQDAENAHHDAEIIASFNE